MTELWSLEDLPIIPDNRGNLTSIEGELTLPFQIARVYYLYDVPSGSSRAGHAHKDLQQCIIAVSGSFDVHLDSGYSKQTLTLNRPSRGLLLNSMVWRVIDNFSSGAVCVVLASHHYDENDYFRNYEEFILAVKSST